MENYENTEMMSAEATEPTVCENQDEKKQKLGAGEISVIALAAFGAYKAVKGAVSFTRKTLRTAKQMYKDAREKERPEQTADAPDEKVEEP